MESLEKKTIGIKIKAKLKKHPILLAMFIGANVAYAPFSIAWKVYAVKKLYDFTKISSKEVSYRSFRQYDSSSFSSNCEINRFDKTEVHYR
jgi:hypothetical protein